MFTSIIEERGTREKKRENREVMHRDEERTESMFCENRRMRKEETNSSDRSCRDI